MLKKFTHWLFGSVLNLSLTLFIVVTSLVLLLTPQNIKTLVKDSGVYNTLPKTLVNQVKNNQNVDSSSIDFKDQVVQDAALKALTPEFVESSTNQFIDGNFNWLEGKSAQPDYKIDVLPAKQVFADELSSYAKERYNKLPNCPRNTLPKSTNPLTIDCKPPFGVDIDELTKLYSLEILNSKEFLPDSTITFANFSGKNFSADNNSSQRIYKAMQVAPYVLSAVIILSAILFILLDESKRQGIKRVGRRLVITSITTFGLILLSSYGLDKLRTSLMENNKTDELTTSIKEVAFSILNSAQVNIVKTAGIISLAFLIIGLILILVTRTKNTSNKDKDISTEIAKDKLKESINKTPVRENKTEEIKTQSPEPTTAPVVKPTNKPRPPLVQ